MCTEQTRRWCLFTSAGDKNAIRLWLKGDTPRRWDLVAAYYGDDDHEFAEIRKLCSHAFRMKGSKYQNLRKLVLMKPQFFDRYSYVWACDDDILMSVPQINEAFQLTEMLGFWVAQPAVLAGGRNSHWITCFAGSQWDYRIVNFVENGVAIFRRDKLIEFLAVYDGTLTGWGIDNWYANFFRANEFGRFGIIDKIGVINPTNQEKGGNEIDRLRGAQSREADWNKVREKYGLAEYPHKVFAYCKLAPERELLRVFLPTRELPPFGMASLEALRRSRWRGAILLLKSGLMIVTLLGTARRSGWRDAIWFLRCGLTIKRQRRAVNTL